VDTVALAATLGGTAVAIASKGGIFGSRRPNAAKRSTSLWNSMTTSVRWLAANATSRPRAGLRRVDEHRPAGDGTRRRGKSPVSFAAEPELLPGPTLEQQRAFLRSYGRMARPRSATPIRSSSSRRWVLGSKPPSSTQPASRAAGSAMRGTPWMRPERTPGPRWRNSSAWWARSWSRS